MVPKYCKELDFAPYYVSRDGRRVVSLISGKELKLQQQVMVTGKPGYLQVWLVHKDGSKRWHKVHRLVAKLFVQNPQLLPEVNHKDGNKLNNDFRNLEWVSHKRNIKHSFENGREASRSFLGKRHSEGSRKIMRDAKVGVSHPKFKGYYMYEGVSYASMQLLADELGTYPMKVKRMLDKGVVTFKQVI